jgi:hypothetical protein
MKNKNCVYLSNIRNFSPFWKDVLSSYHFAKPYTKMNTNELLSIDILNFVPVTDLNGAVAIIRQQSPSKLENNRLIQPNFR